MSKYPPEFNHKFKVAIRERDGYVCAVCGEDGVAVHHINYIKADTHELNCITLCHSCHMTTNGNRDYWRRALTKMIVNRAPILSQPSSDDRLSMYAIQQSYRRRVRARNCTTAINVEGCHRFSLIPESTWAARRLHLRRNKVPYLSIPQPDDTIIVVSRAGTRDLPDNLVDVLHSWLLDVPSKRTVGRSHKFGGLLNLRDP